MGTAVGTDNWQNEVSRHHVKKEYKTKPTGLPLGPSCLFIKVKSKWTACKVMTRRSSWSPTVTKKQNTWLRENHGVFAEVDSKGKVTITPIFQRSFRIR